MSFAGPSNYQKFQILKILLLSPFLLSIPFLNNPEVKAGLEFQWDQDSGYRRLKWFQRERNTVLYTVEENQD